MEKKKSKKGKSRQRRQSEQEQSRQPSQEPQQQQDTSQESRPQPQQDRSRESRSQQQQDRPQESRPQQQQHSPRKHAQSQSQEREQQRHFEQQQQPIEQGRQQQNWRERPSKQQETLEQQTGRQPQQWPVKQQGRQQQETEEQQAKQPQQHRPPKQRNRQQEHARQQQQQQISDQAYQQPAEQTRQQQRTEQQNWRDRSLKQQETEQPTGRQPQQWPVKLQGRQQQETVEQQSVHQAQQLQPQEEHERQQQRPKSRKQRAQEESFQPQQQQTGAQQQQRQPPGFQQFPPGLSQAQQLDQSKASQQQYQQKAPIQKVSPSEIKQLTHKLEQETLKDTSTASAQQVPHPVEQKKSGTQQRTGKKVAQQQQQPVSDVQQKQEKHGDTSSLDLIVPQRKKLNSAGTAGRRIQIETNHLALSFKKLNELAIHYDVAIEPNLPKRLLRPAMEEFRRKHYPNRSPAFDGIKNLYSSSPLPFKDTIEGEANVTEDDRQKTFKIKIQFANKVDLNILTQYFQHAAVGNRHLVSPQEALQCIEIVLRSAPAFNCIIAGRSFFRMPEIQANLGGGMEMYTGYYQSAILGWKPFLNVDVAHKAFPKNMPVLSLMEELCPRYSVNERFIGHNIDTVSAFLRTLKILYLIPNNPASRRVMRVNEFDNTPASSAYFKTDDGQRISVEVYYKTIKNYKLKYPHLPCLWVGSRQRESKMLYPPELCTVIEGQVVNRTMTADQTSAMIKHAVTDTRRRKQNIMNSIYEARYNENPCIKEFGISIDHNFTKVPARVLDPPSLQYQQNQITPEKGVWRASKFLQSRVLENWYILCLDDRTRRPALEDFTTLMFRQATSLGMDISRPEIIELRLQYNREKQQLEVQFKKLVNPLLVVVIIPENKDIYGYVKQVAELTVGTLTQCIRGRTIFRSNNASTIGNILLKINAKLNGTNHRLVVRPKILNKPCMIMGADVTHPSPESRGTVPSVAAVTASHDPYAFKYNICWRLQPATQEIILDLTNIVREHLLYFYRTNKTMKPESIIVFRDGVSEGQFEIVFNLEVQAIRKACLSVQGDGLYKPRVTFLVVQKRHHTRFFPTNPKDSHDRNCNVPAGTVVDTEITQPTALDFYLVSHASIQGVARPTKYRMLWDENDMTEDELEQLTYHLCHLFTRCTRSVSYPAPTYYAHLAAARAKVYCEKRHISMDNLQHAQRQLEVKDDIIKGMPMFFV